MMRYPVTVYRCVEQDCDIDGDGELHVIAERILYEGSSYDECEAWLDDNKDTYRKIDTDIVAAVEEW